jgi:hypothetical protein
MKCLFVAATIGLGVVAQAGDAIQVSYETGDWYIMSCRADDIAGSVEVNEYTRKAMIKGGIKNPQCLYTSDRTHYGCLARVKKPSGRWNFYVGTGATKEEALADANRKMQRDGVDGEILSQYHSYGSAPAVASPAR